MGFLFILKRIGFFFLDNWRVVLPRVGVLVLVICIYRVCNRPPKLDEAAIQKAQQAIAVQDRKAMVEILTQSDVAEKQIDANIANAKSQALNAINDARKNAETMTNDELAAELERRLKQ